MEGCFDTLAGIKNEFTDIKIDFDLQSQNLPVKKSVNTKFEENGVNLERQIYVVIANILDRNDKSLAVYLKALAKWILMVQHLAFLSSCKL